MAIPPRPVRPFLGNPGTMQFYIPPTIQSDFENYLDTDVPNVNFTWHIIKDWSKKDLDDYVPTYCRAESYPINWKSNFANADNTSNFKTDLRVPIYKGDIAVREDGQIYQLNWKVEKRINDQSTQAQECNLMITILRRIDAEIDPSTGYAIRDKYYKEIVSNHPCAIYQYDGRPAFDVNSNSPGVSPDAITISQIQWNDATKNLRIGDEFEWMVDRYVITNLDYGGINIHLSNGMLKLHAKKMGGSSDQIDNSQPPLPDPSPAPPYAPPLDFGFDFGAGG